MPSAKSVLIALFTAALLGTAQVCASSGAPGESRHRAREAKGWEQKEVRLLLAGDILLSRGVETVLGRNSRSVAAALHDVFAGADWALGNLEGAVGSAQDCVDAGPAGRSPCFPVRKERVSLLREMGFKAVGMENNHAMDCGPAGRRATRDALLRNGLTPLSFEDSPLFVRAGAATLGIIGFSTVSTRMNVNEAADFTELRRKLRQAGKLADFVIVYVHWGSEFLDWPDEDQRRTARRLVKSGADIIVGHHPHVAQGLEILSGKPVLYSLGNFLFDQRYPATKEGLLADCRIKDGEARCSALTVRTPVNSVRPSVEGLDGEAADLLGGCVVKARMPLTVNGIVLKPEGSDFGDGWSGLVLEARSGTGRGEFLWKSQRAVIASIEKMTVEGVRGEPRKKEYLFTLEPHASPMDGEEALRPCVYDVRPDGLAPKWRGTALAWPLLDAALLPGEDGVLCALHRGDSFLVLRPESRERRVAAYRWNGFGFSGAPDPALAERCRTLFE